MKLVKWDENVIKTRDCDGIENEQIRQNMVQARKKGRGCRHSEFFTAHQLITATRFS